MANPTGKNQFSGGRKPISALLSHKPDVKLPKNRSVALRHQVAQRALEQRVAKMLGKK